MGHPVSLNTPTGRISAWRADPAIPPRGAIVVVQEIFGVNAHIRAVVDRFAAHGYTAIAPAFFDHFSYKQEFGYDEDGVAKGRELVDKLGFDKAVADVQASVEEVDEVGHVGVVGYCWGGTIALLSALRLGLPAVSYYGARNVPFLGEKPKAPVMFHFGEDDPSIPPEAVAQHRELLPQMEVFSYPGAGHAFNRDVPGDKHYHGASAMLAWQRTLEFFDRQLAGA